MPESVQYELGKQEQKAKSKQHTVNEVHRVSDDKLRRISLSDHAARLQPQLINIYVGLLGAFDVAPFGGIHANTIALVYEWWNLNGNSVLQGRGFINVRDGRTLHLRFSPHYGQFHRGRQVDSDRRSLVKLSLKFEAGRQPGRRIAKLFFTQRHLLIIRRI